MPAPIVLTPHSPSFKIITKQHIKKPAFARQSSHATWPIGMATNPQEQHTSTEATKQTLNIHIRSAYRTLRGEALEMPGMHVANPPPGRTQECSAHLFHDQRGNPCGDNLVYLPSPDPISMPTYSPTHPTTYHIL